MSDYDEEEPVEEPVEDFANADEIIVPEGQKSPWKKGEYVSPADEFVAAENELTRLLKSPKTADFVGRRPHGTGAGALENGPGGYLGDATDEMELGFFVVPGFEKKVAYGPEIPAHGGKKLVIKNNHPNREWDRDLALKMATTGMFRPAPGVPNKLGGLTEFTNDRVYMESLHWADAKDYTNKMLRVAARKWNPKSDPGFMADVKTRLQDAFDAELKNGFKNGFSPQKKPWSEFSSIPRMREKALMIEEAE